MKEEMKKRGLQPVTFSEVITEVNEQVVDTQICRAAPVDPGSGSGSGGGSGNLGPDSFSEIMVRVLFLHIHHMVALLQNGKLILDLIGRLRVHMGHQ